MTQKPKRMRLIALFAVMTAAVLSVITCGEVCAARDYGGEMWKIDSGRSRISDSSGSWKTGIRARADGGPGDSIAMGSNRSVSNTVSATLGIPIRKVNSSFMFNVNRQWSSNVNKSYGLTGKKKGSWWAIQYKPVYRNYRVRARRYSFYDGIWHKTKRTRWIKARRFSHFAYRLVPSKAPA